jgi:type I restriction enzyme M protein
MARGKREKRGAGNSTAANVGYEAQLWQMADALRGSMDAAEYKHCSRRLTGHESP